jgi:hypothetical protein
MTEPVTLRDQLETVRDRLYGRRAEVQPVSQVTLEIPSADPVQTLERVRHMVLEWMAERAGRSLPSAAWQGQAFELNEVGAQPVEGVVIAEPPCWAARIDDADRVVPQRTWVTEVALAIAGSDRVIFACRLYCVARGENPPYGPSVPRFVRQVAGGLGARLDGRPLSPSAWNVDTQNAVRELVQLLVSPSRKSPVIVVSRSNETGETLIPADRLAEEAIGVAHVVSLSANASYHLTDLLGKEFSAFNQAVRTFRPGFDPEQDQPSAHPLAMAPAIENWSNRGPDGFRRFLINQALRESVSRRDLEAELPSFATMKVIATRQAREQAGREGRSDRELLDLALKDNEQLRQKFDEDEATYQGLIEAAEKDLEHLTRERDEARSEAANLRFRIAHLEKALQSQDISEELEIPSSLEDLEAWCNRYLAGSVQVLNRAFREARRSQFGNPELAYRALLVLRDHYVPMRREGGLDRKEGYERALRELDLEETASFGGSRAAEQGDEYFVAYQGQRRELDRHLKGDSRREERYGFRLYFFWDADTQQVVVGWLPSHLKTRAT